MDTIELLRQFQQPGWDIYPSHRQNALIAFIPLCRCECRKFLKRISSPLAVSAAKFGFPSAVVHHLGEGKPFRIPAAAVGDYMNGLEQYLQNADYLRVLDFMREKRAEGKIVIITSQIDNICIHTNDLLLPERGVLRPYQWRGYNYLQSWDVERTGQPSEEYHQMRALLDQDGFIPGYGYRLRRPDGALCEYQTDYYTVGDYCGEPVRIGVSDPQAWRILEPAA